jgi:soluble epoxide hydrolase/lipid-phosphate phosphatase
MVEAVFFDLGGVVLESPIHAITRIEQEYGLPRHSLNKALGLSPLFQQLERGEISLEEFCPAFQQYLHNEALKEHSDKLAGFDVAKFMNVDIGGPGISVRPHFANAIQKLRANGFKVIAVTNNWKNKLSDSNGAGFQFLGDQKLLQKNPEYAKMAGMFDDIVESCVVGKRKPDPAIFRTALSKAGIQDASKVAFLDDIRTNILGAQKLGFRTIHVKGNGKAALQELSEIVGIDLLDNNASKL